MNFFNNVKVLYVAIVILLITVCIALYVDNKNEKMHVRHREITIGLERMVRLNQELTNMLRIAALEQNTLRTASYDTLDNELNETITTVLTLTSSNSLLQEISTLRAAHDKLHSIELKAINLMKDEHWAEAGSLLFNDDYRLVRKKYEIDTESAVGAVSGELAKTAANFGKIRIIALGMWLGSILLLVWTGAVFSRKTRLDLAEQVRLRNEIAAANEILEERVIERTQELSAAYNMLEQSRNKIMESIRYARIIQSSILPESSELQSSLGNHFVLYRPKEIVGGDFYYLRAYEGYFLLATIDCTGHGVAGAFMTMTVNSVLNHVVDVICSDDPGCILSELNRVLRRTMHFREIDSGLDIALCKVDRLSGTIIFAGAGLSFYQASQDGVREIKGDHQRIGYKGSNLDFSYRNNAVQIVPGDTCYLATDGILDEPNGEKGYGFGTERFKNLLAENFDHDMAYQMEKIESTLEEFRAGRASRDDVTLIGFSV